MRIDGELLDGLYRQGALEAIDVHFGRCIAGLDAETGPALSLAAALTSHWTRLGHVCTELAALAGQPLGDTKHAPRAPGLEAWLAALQRSPAVGAPGERRPLVLDGRGRLYLFRYWHYEQEVAESLLERVREGGARPEPGAVCAALDAIVPANQTVASDGQRLAGVLAVSRRLCVVSGGPGTGKTTAVIAILKLLDALHGGGGRRPRIGLAAPTGKAAARMQEAVSQSGGVDAGLEATTLHRLLGFRPGSPRPRHDRDTPLPLEALIVDEASMIDVGLMAKLLRALPRRARLILVGDKDQLGPIEAGAVLADLCRGAGGYSRDYAQYLGRCTGLALPAATGPGTAFADSIVHLQQGFRYRAGGGLSRLAQAILQGDPDEAVALCRSGLPGLRWHEPTDPRQTSGLTAITEGYREYCRSLQSGAAPAAVLAALRQFRILCAHRAGPYGAEAWHRRAERVLTEAGMLDARGDGYPGRPLIIERNDYAARLFNGDTGVLLPDPAQDGALRAYFEGADGTLRGLAPGRLPAHSGLFAITVHKSQGSEHERVLLVLPPWDTPLLTRELLYTAVTRARCEVEVWGRESVLRAAIGRSLRRGSGLAEALGR